MTSNRRIIVAILLCLGITSVGTIGYTAIEGCSLLDGIYMAVITITTVGFGEVVPLSHTGRIFTIFLIIIGFGSLAFAGHAVVESLLEKVWRSRMDMKKMMKKISRLKGHYIICGHGRMGTAAAEYFIKAGADCVIIESKSEYDEQLKETGHLYIEGDATREAVLLDAGIKSAQGLLALLDSDPDNLFLVLTARELNPTLHIIARVEDASSEKKILRAGADSVVLPFTTAGKQVADDILVATGKHIHKDQSLICSRSVPKWITIQEGSSMSGENVSTVSEQMAQKIIGLRREGKDLILPDPETRLQASDMILILDETQSLQDQVPPPSEPPKIVIVDDNPVILRLYTRLFQKAGFYPITATDGREGLNTILKEKPTAAVIDFMLPVLSGIDICEKIRSSGACPETKLILFTSDTQSKTKKQALKAGADIVVHKSPEASEIVETVIQILKEDQDM